MLLSWSSRLQATCIYMCMLNRVYILQPTPIQSIRYPPLFCSFLFASTMLATSLLHWITLGIFAVTVSWVAPQIKVNHEAHCKTTRAIPTKREKADGLNALFKARGKKFWVSLPQLWLACCLDLNIFKGSAADPNTLSIKANVDILAAEFGSVTPEYSMKASVDRSTTFHIYSRNITP